MLRCHVIGEWQLMVDIVGKFTMDLLTSFVCSSILTPEFSYVLHVTLRIRHALGEGRQLFTATFYRGFIRRLILQRKNAACRITVKPFVAVLTRRVRIYRNDERIINTDYNFDLRWRRRKVNCTFHGEGFVAVVRRLGTIVVRRIARHYVVAVIFWSGLHPTRIFLFVRSENPIVQ